MEFTYKKDMMKDYIKQIENDEIKTEAALEGFFESVGNDINGFGWWLADRIENITLNVLDAIGVDEHHDKILSPAKQVILADKMATYKFSVNARLLISVPVGLKKDFPAFSAAAITCSSGLDVKANQVMDSIEVLMSSLASGNGMEALASVKVQLAALDKSKKEYLAKTKKYLQKARNTRLFLTKAYSKPDELVSTFALLKGRHPLLRASFASQLVRRSRGLSSTYKLIDKTKLKKGDLLNLLHVMQGSISTLEYTGLAIVDIMSCVASMDNQILDIRRSNFSEGHGQEGRDLKKIKRDAKNGKRSPSSWNLFT